MSAVKPWSKVTRVLRLICALLTEFQSVTCSAWLAGARRDPKGGQSGHGYCKAPHSLLAGLPFSALITRWRRICDCLVHPFFTHLPVSSVRRNHVHTAYRCDSSPRGCTYTHTLPLGPALGLLRRLSLHLPGAHTLAKDNDGGEWGVAESHAFPQPWFFLLLPQVREEEKTYTPFYRRGSTATWPKPPGF